MRQRIALYIFNFSVRENFTTIFRMAKVAVCAFLFLSFVSMGRVCGQVAGVKLVDQEKYTGESFICDEKMIPATKINDDYCDCADGSDEPGTSACKNSKFWCENKGYIGQYVFSSRVNDGICDCCDGTDENVNDNIVACTNTCWEEGETFRKEQEMEIMRPSLHNRLCLKSEKSSQR